MSRQTQDGSSEAEGTEMPGGVTLAATAARLVFWQGLVKLLGSRFSSTCSRCLPLSYMHIMVVLFPNDLHG